MAVTSTRVALEKNRVGLRMISGATETPSDWKTTSIPVSARFTVAISRASPAFFSSWGCSTRILRADNDVDEHAILRIHSPCCARRERPRSCRATDQRYEPTAFSTKFCGDRDRQSRYRHVQRPIASHIHLRGFFSSITAHVAAAVIPPSATSSKTSSGVPIGVILPTRTNRSVVISSLHDHDRGQAEG